MDDRRPKVVIGDVCSNVPRADRRQRHRAEVGDEPTPDGAVLSDGARLPAAPLLALAEPLLRVSLEGEGGRLAPAPFLDLDEPLAPLGRGLLLRPAVLGPPDCLHHLFAG